MSTCAHIHVYTVCGVCACVWGDGGEGSIYVAQHACKGQRSTFRSPFSSLEVLRLELRVFGLCNMGCFFFFTRCAVFLSFSLTSSAFRYAWSLFSPLMS